MLPWIVGSLALATLAWFTVRPLLRDSASDWTGPLTLPPAPPVDREADAAEELLSWIEDGTCPECGALSLAGNEVELPGRAAAPRWRVFASCEECEFEAELEHSR